MVDKRNNFSLETDEKKIRTLFTLVVSFRNAGLVVSISLQRTRRNFLQRVKKQEWGWGKRAKEN